MQVILPMSDYVRLVHEHANASRLLRECCAAVRAADAERDRLRAALEIEHRDYLHATNALETLRSEHDRYRAALEMLAQTRHVTGSAQGVFRSNLRIVDCVLLGADVRDLATVEAIAVGTWKPE